MTPTYKISSAPSPNFPAANDLMDRQPVFFGPNNYHQAAVAASSSYLHTCNFFYSTSGDQSEYYSNHKELQHPQIQQHQAGTIALNGGSYDIENESSGNGLRFSILKKDDKYENHDQIHQSTNNYQVKRMPSKIRLMLKMKNADRTAAKAPTSTTSSLKLDQEQRQPSSPKEFIDNSSKTFSSNSSNPVRVCSDCNTTKTPLWRSGPQGPKTLCNACGIRQRKARRAMAAAAAENGTTVDQTKATTPIVLKTNKTQQRDKRPTSCSHFTTKYKKHAATSSHQGKKKPCFEDFLVNLSNNLAFHRVFPQDEKDAAILLMALSCDLIHG